MNAHFLPELLSSEWEVHIVHDKWLARFEVRKSQTQSEWLRLFFCLFLPSCSKIHALFLKITLP